MTRNTLKTIYLFLEFLILFGIIIIVDFGCIRNLKNVSLQ